MKKIKTYGKIKSKKDLNTNEWDEIKEIQINNGNPRHTKIQVNNECESKVLSEVTENNMSLDLFTTDNLVDDASVFYVPKVPVTKEKENMCQLFKDLSINNHSTPIFSSGSGENSKSKCGTPLKSSTRIDTRTAEKRLLSSDHSFACIRSVIFASSLKKAFGRKTPRNYSNHEVLQRCSGLDESSIIYLGRVSFKDALTISKTYTEAETKILNICEQDRILSIEEVLSSSRITKKIGEGSYGEVFYKEESDSCSAIKIIPVGELEDQIKLNEIIPEIAISKKLSNWKTSKQDVIFYPGQCVEGFIELKKLYFCKGRFPKHLIELWVKWKKDSTNDCQNIHPGSYEDDQLYVVFENSFGGEDLEKFKVKTMREALSILNQLVATLAAAECSLQFEHRDLHWGNILIRRTNKSTRSLKILIDNKEFSIEHHGLTVSIIDFTLSRLVSEGCAVFTDLSSEKKLFTGEGDEQFDVYRNMKENNKNEWESFHPYTNVLWIHYVANKLVSKLPKIVTLKKLVARILNYESAYDLLVKDDLFG